MYKSLKYERAKRQLPLHLMVMPAIVMFILFNYIPMGGIIMAFQDFNPVKGFFGSKFIGFENFEYIFNLPDSMQVIWNTVYLIFCKLVVVVLFAVIFSLLLNEIKIKFIKKSVQSVVFFPYFLSWAILGGILIDIFSPSGGLVNMILTSMGKDSVFFMADLKAFPIVLIISHAWKEFGYSSIICLASLSSISPELYEAAYVDGAGRWNQMKYITLPAILPTIFVLLILNWVVISNGQHEQIMVLYSPAVYQVSDVIDTYALRLGLYNAQYGVATAFGLMKSVVNTIFVLILYKLAYKFANYKMF